MKKTLQSQSPYRIFGFSIVMTLLAIIGTFIGKGLESTVLILFLMVIEIVFSFDNAIINAKVLQKMSAFWQKIFLTVGILIAVFGMRVLFPIVIVMATAGLGWHEVISLAFNNPQEYARELHHAHPMIAAFGGAFLLTLGLYFLTDKSKNVHWWTRFEKGMQASPEHWAAPVLAVLAVSIVALLPMNTYLKEVFIYGFAGVLTYVALYSLTQLLEKYRANHPAKIVKNAIGLTGWAAFTSFLYLEILDASFSFDGVIGAFAITTNVVLIAIGLGVGAIWVRSLTIFIIRRGTLHAYKFLEHGAHYAIIALALTMFASIFLSVPEWLAGAISVMLIAASIVSSRRANQQSA